LCGKAEENHENYQSGQLAIEDDLDSTIVNAVASTVSKWQKFKL
jgi:hypothetical protein